MTNVALVIISDRGERYLPRMKESLAKFVDYPWSATVEVDDGNHVYGMAGAVRHAWSQLPKNTDYVFHVEEDWLFLEPVDVDAMCRTITDNTHLAQIVLKRGPCILEEFQAGGFVELAPSEYEDCAGWLEHKRCFSLNPCVYPYWLTTSGVPSDPNGAGVEAVLTQRFLAQGLVFGVWGARSDPPQIEHIGYERSAGWKL